MGDLPKRAYRPTDAPALTDLMNLLEEHGGAQGGYTVDQVASYQRAVVADAEADTRLVFTPEGELIAFAVTGSPPEGGFRVDLEGGVHPAWRGRGLGRELFGAQLARAGELYRQQPQPTRWEAHATAILAEEDSLRLYRRFGLTPIRYWFEMLARTVDVPALPLPDGIRSVRYQAGMEKELHAAHRDAFVDHFGYQGRAFDEWVELTVRMESFAPELSRVAFAGDEIAGYVLSYREADPTSLYIGQVGTRRPYRRRGLAGALLADLLTEAAGIGITKAALGVDADSPTGAVGVYERVGFVVDSRAVSYHLVLGSSS